MLLSAYNLSQIHTGNPHTSVVGNVNIVETGDDGESVPICYLPLLQPFSAMRVGTLSFKLLSYEGLAAVVLAMEHLNTGNGTIVPELDGIDERCPLRFVTRAFDSHRQATIAVDHVISLTDGSGKLVPCGIIGAGPSGISIPTSIVSGLRGLPQISPFSTSDALDDKSQYKLFGRTIPNDTGMATPLVSMLASWGVNYIAILHTNDSFGNAFARAIGDAAQEQAHQLRIESVAITVADSGGISDAIRRLKGTELTYFFAPLTTWNDGLVNKIMTEAYKQGIAGTGLHTWLFGDTVKPFSITGQGFPVGSPLEKAYRGTGIIRAVGGVAGIENFDRLSQGIQELLENENDRWYLEELLPQDLKGKFVNQSLTTQSFATPFFYDAAVALGMSACGLVDNFSGNNEYFTGEELYNAFLNITFGGTSGSMAIDPETGTREPTSARFVLINFVDDEDADVDQGMVKFKDVDSAIFMSGDWDRHIPYTFNDGTAHVSSDLPFLKTNPNYLSSGLKTVGALLCVIITVLALGFSYWSYHNSERRVVRASQPIFLHLISAGTLLMGLAIIPLTMDKGATNQEGADVACMSYPWLLSIGFTLTFSALFTKTYRINQIMESAAKFKRVQVTAIDVMKPMIALLMINVVVLTAWTVIDPYEHHTVIVLQDQFLRNVETYGSCSSDLTYIFVSILLVINLGVLFFAVWQAYKARGIASELQESSYIFIALALILLVSFLSIPIIIIARGNISAFYFVTAGFIFVVCTSILILIFAPKVHALRGQSASTDRAGSVSLGINILNTKMAQSELEKENHSLRQENLGIKVDFQGLKQGIEELQQSLSMEQKGNHEFSQKKHELKQEVAEELKQLLSMEQKGNHLSRQNNDAKSEGRVRMSTMGKLTSMWGSSQA